MGIMHRLEVHCEHDKRQTIMRLYEYDKLIGEKPYDYFFLIGVIEHFKGSDSCGDGLRRKIMGLGRKKLWERMSCSTYWNRPFHDVYGKI